MGEEIAEHVPVLADGIDDCIVLILKGGKTERA